MHGYNISVIRMLRVCVWNDKVHVDCRVVNVNIHMYCYKYTNYLDNTLCTIHYIQQGMLKSAIKRVSPVVHTLPFSSLLQIMNVSMIHIYSISYWRFEPI